MDELTVIQTCLSNFKAEGVDFKKVTDAAEAVRGTAKLHRHFCSLPLGIPILADIELEKAEHSFVLLTASSRVFFYSSKQSNMSLSSGRANKGRLPRGLAEQH